mmetsp:Transcript_15901/g.40685  ORF Transcript_15901/g.40685 Transcript_15901/m.40685 type:complete len:217 (-) Transcript_15901:486-1136(-)
MMCNHFAINEDSENIPVKGQCKMIVGRNILLLTSMDIFGRVNDLNRVIVCKEVGTVCKGNLIVVTESDAKVVNETSKKSRSTNASFVDRILRWRCHLQSDPRLQGEGGHRDRVEIGATVEGLGCRQTNGDTVFACLGRIIAGGLRAEQVRSTDHTDDGLRVQRNHTARPTALRLVGFEGALVQAEAVGRRISARLLAYQRRGEIIAGEGVVDLHRR